MFNSSQYGKMPWLSMVIEGSAEYKNKLAQTLGITGIPSVAIIDLKTGEFILGGEARDDVMAAGGDKDKVVATIAKWKSAERHPLEAASKLMNVGGSQNLFFSFLSFLAKNPMIIFGFMYFVKYFQRKFNGSEEPPEVEEVVAGDTEF